MEFLILIAVHAILVTTALLIPQQINVFAMKAIGIKKIIHFVRLAILHGFFLLLKYFN